LLRGPREVLTGLRLELAQVDREQIDDRGPEHRVGGVHYREVSFVGFDPERSKPCGYELLGSIRTLHSGGQPYSGGLAGIVQPVAERRIPPPRKAESCRNPDQRPGFAA
jgi:hypothetical protein